MRTRWRLDFGAQYDIAKHGCYNGSMNKPFDKSSERAPQPTDIEPGQTQFLRYRNSLVRGTWYGTGPVAVTWSSGFATSCPVNAWNDRLFVEQPNLARLIEDHEIPSAKARFARLQEDQRQVAKISRLGYRR